MARKKNISDAHLIDWYIQDVTENNKEPESVLVFAKSFNFKESSFYEHFGSLKELEQAIYKSFFDQTYNMLNEMQGYSNFTARHKLISFYYTFFEILTLNRAFVIINLNCKKRYLGPLKSLKGLRKALHYYIDTLRIETLQLNSNLLTDIQTKFLEEAAWIQFLSILNFWMHDTSNEFEKSDILIEKSINTSFEWINIQPLQSAIDLGKFLLNEKLRKQS